MGFAALNRVVLLSQWVSASLPRAGRLAYALASGRLSWQMPVWGSGGKTCQRCLPHGLDAPALCGQRWPGARQDD